MRCLRCGIQNGDGARFCVACGQALSGAGGTAPNGAGGTAAESASAPVPIGHTRTAPPTQPGALLQGGAPRGYTPLGTLGAVVVGLIVGGLVTTVLALGAGLTVAAQLSGEGVMDEAGPAVLAQGCVALLHVALYVVSGVVFLVWLHRASGNLRALGAEGQRYSPGWAVGAWFVPLANLVWPYEAVREIFAVSVGMERRRIAIVGWWWATYLLANVTATVGARIAWRTEDPVWLLAGEWISCVSDAVQIVELVLVMRIVQAVTRGQGERMAEIAAG
jgi:hypothetical protein